MANDRPRITGRQRNSGFTLIELMVTLTVLVIGLSLAVPSIRVMAANNEVSQANNAILTGLNLARSEAITRGNEVTICPSGNSVSCRNGRWHRGWIVFDNADGNGTLTAAEVIRRDRRNTKVVRRGFSGPITFRPDGTTGLDSAKNIKICYSQTSVTNKCRTISISRFGIIKSQASTS